MNNANTKAVKLLKTFHAELEVFNCALFNTSLNTQELRVSRKLVISMGNGFCLMEFPSISSEM